MTKGSGYDLEDIKRKIVAEYGQEWWDKYGEASQEAALVVMGDQPTTGGNEDE